MYIYRQSTGQFYSNNTLLCVGYAGSGIGMNNPLMQDQRNIGPLPLGLYRIGFRIDSTHLGIGAIPLHSHPQNQMFGRGDFYLHQDNRRGDKSASTGCIILPFEILKSIEEMGDKHLVVVSW